MNYLSMPVRRGSIWHEDHGASASNLLPPGRRKSTTFTVMDRRKSTDSTQEESTQISKNLKKLAVIVSSKKYQDVDWHRLNINVGGRKFCVYKGTLKQFPTTKLAKLTEQSEEYDKINNEYFFDRNPDLFQYILDVYRDGETHFPKYCCPITVRDELEFWGLGMDSLSRCCRKYFCDGLDEIFTYETLRAEFSNAPNKLYGVESHANSFDEISDYRRNIWMFLDDPQFSLKAKIWAIFNMLLIILSIVSLFAGSLSSCRVVPSGGIFSRHVDPTRLQEAQSVTGNTSQQSNDSTGDQTTTEKSSSTQGYLLSNKKINLLLTTQPHDALLSIDLFCMLFFTIEFVVRFSVCPRRVRLLTRMTTVVDILYLAPMWLLFMIDIIDHNFWHKSDRIVGLLIMKNLMVLRVFRIIRLFRHYRGLKILLLAVRASANELFLLLVFVLFSITVFASLIYCAEISNEQEFDSLFIGLWWALITMTTVGYGDFYPRTWPGYIVGCICALTGIIVIGLVVPIIASNFHAYYGLNIYEQDTENPEQTVPKEDTERPKPVDVSCSGEDLVQQVDEHNDQITTNSNKASTESMIRVKTSNTVVPKLTDVA